MTAFSIIVCTYNPNPEIFQRLLDALLRFDESPVPHEVIVVDNNSVPELRKNEAVKAFLSVKRNATIITEQNPGLTNARIAGIKAARADWLIFFDDDNEPVNDYLVEAQKLIFDFPEVGAWGPGNIAVEFCGGEVSEWIHSQKQLFQERSASETAMDDNTTYQDCYPHGTGLMLQKLIAQQYVSLWEKGALTLTDRKGNNLSSGGDTQLVLLCLRTGLKAGISPKLTLTHLIASHKATPGYLKKQVYHTSASYFQAYNQVFPEAGLAGSFKNSLDIVKSLYAAYRIHHHTESRESFHLRWARILGEYASPYHAAGVTKPLILRVMENYFINH